MEFSTVEVLLAAGGLLIIASAMFGMMKPTYNYAVNDGCDRGCGKGRAVGSNVCSENLITGVCNKNEASKLV